jgi:diguanylate cyclase (GGDEF)-like protein
MLEYLRALRWRRAWCNRYAPHLPAAIMAASFLILLLAARQFGWLQALEVTAFDRMLRWQATAPPHPDILIVGISEADIQHLQQWPLKDGLLAQALNHLRRHGASMIGMDIYRDFPHQPGHAELLTELAEGPVIAIKKLGFPASSQVAPPKGVPLERVGFSDLIMDSDGVVRRAVLYAKVENTTYSAFAMQLAMHHLWKQGISPRNSTRVPNGFEFGASTFAPLPPQAGAYSQINTDGFQILLNYRRYPLPAEVVSFSDVLADKISADKIRGRIVLIGVTAPSVKDIHFTPYSGVSNQDVYTPGVLIHAHIVSQILDAVASRSGFVFWPNWAEVLWLLAWGGIAALLAIRIHHLLRFQIVALSSLGLLAACHWVLFQQGIWIPMWEAFLAFLAGSVSILAGRLAYAAFYDQLTGLPNQLNLIQRLHGLLRRSAQPRLALLLLELDRYKLINAVFGPQVGDAFLIEMAERLRQFADTHGDLRIRRVCGDIMPIRAGGAEFALLVINPGDANSLNHLIAKLRKQCAKPLHHNGEDIFLNMSIGIALKEQNYHGNLLRDAHSALSQAKALGLTEKIFDGEIKAEEIKSFQLERELYSSIYSKTGLEKRVTQPSVEQPRIVSAKALELPHLPDFLVYYQPLVDLHSGYINGFEALVRWQHPQRGFLPPNAFIPVAEKCGAILPIGKWVLLQACRQMKIWQDSFPDLLISVNLATPQLLSPDTLPYVQAVLLETGLAPASLKLEITESAAIQNLDVALQLLHACRDLNIKLALDDFGTGYSSLAYLTQLPIDILKIDMAFVRNMDANTYNRSILRTIARLARDMHLETIAEGIETQAHLAVLRELKCDTGQGYLFGKPMPADAAEKLLHSRARW